MQAFVDIQGAPPALGPYSQAVRAGGFLFVSGQIPLDPGTGEVVRGSIEEETRRALDNLRGVLLGAGLGPEHVVKTTIFVTDLGDFQAVNGVYETVFHPPYPARATVQVAALPRGVRVEIDAVAAYPDPGARS